MWPSRLYILLKDFPQTWMNNQRNKIRDFGPSYLVVSEMSLLFCNKYFTALQSQQYWHQRKLFFFFPVIFHVPVESDRSLILTLHLKGLTGKWTIMCVFSVCFWMKLLKQTWHWKGLTLLWISMCLFRLADRVNSREHTSHLWPFIPFKQRREKRRQSFIKDNDYWQRHEEHGS